MSGAGTFLLLTLVLGAGVLLTFPLVVALMGRISGWMALATHYPSPGNIVGWRNERETVKIGSVLYRRMVTIATNAQGFELSVCSPLVWVFQPPPIFIPWPEIKKIEPDRLYLHPAMKFVIGDPRIGTVTLPMSFEVVVRRSTNVSIPHFSSLVESPIGVPQSKTY